MLSLIVEFLIDQDHVKSFEQHAVCQAKNSLEKEESCHIFEVCHDPVNPKRFVFYELYKDKESFDSHLATPHYHDFEQKTAPWVTFKKVEFFSRVL